MSKMKFSKIVLTFLLKEARKASQQIGNEKRQQ